VGFAENSENNRVFFGLPGASAIVDLIYRCDSKASQANSLSVGTG
jgi:hypothetical protein